MKDSLMPVRKSKSQKKTILVVVPRFEDVAHSFYSGEVIRGMSLGASRLALDLLVHIVDRTSHRQWLETPLLDVRRISGILFADIDNDLNVVKRAIKQGFPTMVLNNDFKQPLNFISINNYQASFDLVNHLASLGHQRMAVIAGEQMTQAGQDRLMGFCDAAKALGLKLPKSYIKFGDFLRTPARKAAQQLLSLKHRPTAIFAASDLMALEVLHVAQSKGVRVPSELSVVGFDDHPDAVLPRIRLSTFAQPLVEMGRLGVERLNSIMEGRERLPFKMRLSAQYIQRESVAPVSK